MNWLKRTSELWFLQMSVCFLGLCSKNRIPMISILSVWWSDVSSLTPLWNRLFLLDPSSMTWLRAPAPLFTQNPVEGKMSRITDALLYLLMSVSYKMGCGSFNKALFCLNNIPALLIFGVPIISSQIVGKCWKVFIHPTFKNWNAFESYLKLSSWIKASWKTCTCS